MTFSEHLDACVVCEGTLACFDEPIVKRIAVRYDVCKRCGLVQMNPRPSPDNLNHYYEEAYRADNADELGAKTGHAQDRRAVQQQAFVARVPDRHLDIGCSMGTLLTAFGSPVQVGVEPGRQHREHAQAADITVFATVEDLAASEPKPFDLITMSHVLEHLPDPAGYLLALEPLLTPGGRLMLEVPYLYRSIAYELAHLMVFSKPSLTTTMRAGGWEVMEMREHTARQGGLGIGHNIAVLAAPTKPRPPGQGHRHVALMRARRKVGFAPQQFYRWRNRQGRRVRRNLAKVARSR